MNRNKITGALWGSFCADAYALGPHWEYNTRNIEGAGLDSGTLNDPITKYHGSKKAGDFTHYGDQMLWLLQSAADKKEFNLQDYGALWTKKMENYTGYVDHASEDTLKNVKKGVGWNLCGSESTDLSGAGRMAPLLLIYADNPEALKKAAVEQTSLTHRSGKVLEAAEFFAELSYDLLNGADLISELESLSSRYSSTIKGWVEAGIKSSKKKSSLTIKKFGQACDVNHGFPGVIHLITKYQNDYKLGMKENAWSGGDSAARGLLAGMILGLINGEKSVPEEWKKNLTSYEEIKNYLAGF